MKLKNALIFLFCLFCFCGQAQTITINANLSNSNNSLIGSNLFHVSESIYSQTEIGASSFIVNPINKIGFNFTQIGNPSQIQSFRVWLKNISNTINTFSSGTYTTSGYTLVYQGTIEPVAAQWYTIGLQTPFFRTANSNLQLLIERLDGVQHLAQVGFTNGFIAQTANGNSSSNTAFSSRRYNGTSAPSSTTSLTITPFRPAIQLIHQGNIDLTILDVLFPAPSCYNTNQQIDVMLTNIGTDSLQPNQAFIHLRSGGANVIQKNVTITNPIAPGDSFHVFIDELNFENQGTSIDSLWTECGLDENAVNDTIFKTQKTSATVSYFPIAEHVETAPLIFSNNSILSGNRNLWKIHTGPYANEDQLDSLFPRSTGNSFFLFDAYSGVNSSGNISRIFSDCIAIPPATASFPNRTAMVEFWMSHDPVAVFTYDSLYLVVSQDKGLTWSRIAGFQRWDENIDLPEWRREVVNLSAFVGQTIQVGFEGVSKYGNAFGIDDIEISVTPFCSNPPIAFAGQGTSICYESKYILEQGNPTLGGSATTGTWTSSGTGSFLGGQDYSTAWQYQPSNEDKIAGEVIIVLITNNPDSLNCNADTSDFVLQIRSLNERTETITVCDSLIWHNAVYRESGSYQWIGVAQSGCDSVVNLQLTINVKTTKTDSIQTCLPYLWHGNYYAVSGNYFFVSNNTNGCDSIEQLVLQMIPCSINLTLKAMLEGYYIGNGNMRTLLYDLGASTNNNEVDSLTIILANNANAQTQYFEYQTIIKKDGTMNLILPDSFANKSFFIGVRSRNHLKTWSSNAIVISYQTLYDFTVSETKALSDGINSSMKQLADGAFAFYVGDINSDGTIDLFDLQQTENDAAQFLYGYQYSDANGDTVTDLFDLQLIENNSSLFIFSTIPF